MFSFTYVERKCIISYRVGEIYGDGSAHNSCFCSILSGIILGYVVKCFRDRGLPSSFLLFFLDNRERNMPSFLPPGRAYRGSNANHPCSTYGGVDGVVPRTHDRSALERPGKWYRSVNRIGLNYEKFISSETRELLPRSFYPESFSSAPSKEIL